MPTTSDLRHAKHSYLIDRGDDFADTVTIKEGATAATAVAVDVSARTYTMQLRRKPAGAVVATFAIDMAEADDGKVTYRLSDTTTAALEPGAYGYDFQQIVGTATRTLFGGPFNVSADYTRPV